MNNLEQNRISIAAFLSLVILFLRNYLKNPQLLKEHSSFSLNYMFDLPIQEYFDSCAVINPISFNVCYFLSLLSFKDVYYFFLEIFSDLSSKGIKSSLILQNLIPDSFNNSRGCLKILYNIRKFVIKFKALKHILKLFIRDKMP
jgi:hypothetical protein